MGGLELVAALKATGLYDKLMPNVRLGWYLAIIVVLLDYIMRAMATGSTLMLVVDSVFLLWILYSAIKLDLSTFRPVAVVAGMLQTGLFYIPLMFGLSVGTVLLGVLSFVIGSMTLGYEGARLLTEYTNKILPSR